MKLITLTDIMTKWKAFFEELEIPFILNQSVVLGLKRNGKLFPNERSMEFAVYGEDIKDKLGQMKEDKKYQFFHENKHEAPMGLLYFRDCEIQPIFFKNGKAVYNLVEDKCLVYDEDLLKKEHWGTMIYNDIVWNTPGNVEKFLEQAYGDWKTPNPSYNWNNDANNKMLWSEI